VNGRSLTEGREMSRKRSAAWDGLNEARHVGVVPCVCRRPACVIASFDVIGRGPGVVDLATSTAAAADCSAAAVSRRSR